MREKVTVDNDREGDKWINGGEKCSGIDIKTEELRISI